MWCEHIDLVYFKHTWPSCNIFVYWNCLPLRCRRLLCTCQTLFPNKYVYNRLRTEINLSIFTQISLIICYCLYSVAGGSAFIFCSIYTIQEPLIKEYVTGWSCIEYNVFKYLPWVYYHHVVFCLMSLILINNLLLIHSKMVFIFITIFIIKFISEL